MRCSTEHLHNTGTWRGAVTLQPDGIMRSVGRTDARLTLSVATPELPQLPPAGETFVIIADAPPAPYSVPALAPRKEPTPEEERREYLRAMTNRFRFYQNQLETHRQDVAEGDALRQRGGHTRVSEEEFAIQMARDAHAGRAFYAQLDYDRQQARLEGRSVVFHITPTGIDSQYLHIK